MLRQGYIRLGALAYKAIGPFMRLYLTNKHLRVRVLLLNPAGEVLLVRSWLGHQSWSLPGGGLQRGEVPLDAAIREIKEETGLTVPPRKLSALGTFINPYKPAPFTIACFVATIKKEEPAVAMHHKLEVFDAGWFSLQKLPADCSPVVKKALKLQRTA
ncbi:MAG TPA: NUDIX hydrolase [Candidatus Saccharimonas sp.]|nr:NUDIX hydrolase [Candidatus Saccharimonas sp.]